MLVVELSVGIEAFATKNVVTDYPLLLATDYPLLLASLILTVVFRFSTKPARQGLLYLVLPRGVFAISEGAVIALA